MAVDVVILIAWKYWSKGEMTVKRTSTAVPTRPRAEEELDVERALYDYSPK
jgi:hypothetical protein